MIKRGIGTVVDAPKSSYIDDVRTLIKFRINAINTDDKFEIINEQIDTVIKVRRGDCEESLIVKRFKRKYAYMSFTFYLDELLDDAPKNTRAVLRYMIKKAGINSNFIEFKNKRELMREIGYVNNKGERVSFNECTFYKIINWLKENSVIFEDGNRFVFNHNYFIYGNYDNFISDYLKAYGQI